MSTTSVIILVIAVIAIGLAVWALMRSRNRTRLRTKFGPEYERLVQQERDPSRVDAELLQREKRVKKLNIREVSPRERERFAASWRTQQQLFVDDPRTAVMNADLLVAELMEARGYPMNDFRTQVADVSVDHPRVVSNYLEGHEIAGRCRTGQAGTEDMRRAMVCYRTLFEDLLGTKVTEREPQEVKING